MVDIENASIAGILFFIWVAVIDALIDHGVAITATSCGIAAAVCALLLSGRVLTHGMDLMSRDPSSGKSYLGQNVLFFGALSLLIGFSGLPAQILLQE